MPNNPSEQSPQEIIDSAQQRVAVIEQAKQYEAELLDLYANNPMSREKISAAADSFISDLVNLAFDTAEGTKTSEQVTSQLRKN